ncbi:MAG: hypothetical protein FD161_3552 [Limisphaerales bacterium]|nr:MAG: hypothetical protein FD161_3552 [Limisphaerales bacterium]KAG0507607.1 MAG: hypothetical protein E1N63_3218 [Limisphaerales bacterium]TXT48216.1 MAG: hypothetical protein FD140_3728 [Limisphaerales bacterium]
MKLKTTETLRSRLARLGRHVTQLKPRALLRQGTALFTLAAFLNWSAHAAAPPAGATIGNQASATYTDGSNTKRTVTSNVAVTIVQQVASFTLTADNAKTASPGGQVTFPHTLVNTGNGSDAFALSLANLTGDDYDFTGLAIYADANGDGIADNATPITTSGPLAAGAVFQFVVAGIVPATASASQAGKARVTATSGFDATQTASNTDTATASANAVISVSKAVSVGSGPSPSGPYSYTITYQNSGNTAATNLTLTDIIPTGLTYATNSARWSVTGSAVLTDASNLDAQGTTPNTVTYDFGITAPGRVTAVIASVAPGQSGTLTFQVNVNSGVAPGPINNRVSYSYNDGANPVGPFDSNPAVFTVQQTASVTLSGSTVASASQGGTVTFTNLLTNTGNGTDTFDITVDSSSFPAGSTVAILQPDANTPMTDSNGNNRPDTGPLAPGAAYNVVVRVTLPPGVTGGGPYALSKRATSANNSAVSATASDTLTTIAPNTVDLSNNSAGSGAPGFGNPGAGSGNGQPEAAAVTVNTNAPGTTSRFTLHVNNTSSSSDTYNLAASTDLAFAAQTLPAGWSVVFRDASEAVVTSTGVILAGGNKLVYADMTIPANQTPGTTDIYFRVASPTTGASDRKHDAVTVSTVRRLSLTPNNSGQVYAGGSVVYPHTLVNQGNVLEGDGSVSTIALATADSQTSSGFSSVIYRDANGNGVLDTADPVVSNLSGLGGLAPGASATLFVKVFAPAGASPGAVDVTTLTATTANGTYTTPVPAAVSVTDNSSVISGDLTILKEQALDANNDGIADGPFTTQDISTGATPGKGIVYRLTVTNTGAANATSVVVYDATPTFTTYSSATPAATTQGTVTAPANGAAGTIAATIGTMTPGQTVTVTFGVNINN